MYGIFTIIYLHLVDFYGKCWEIYMDPKDLFHQQLTIPGHYHFTMVDLITVSNHLPICPWSSSPPAVIPKGLVSV